MEKERYNLNCLLICLQLAACWDQPWLKKLLKKIGLKGNGGKFDKSFALCRLHQELHNPEGRIATELINCFDRLARDDAETLKTIPADDNCKRLLNVTNDMIAKNPASAFWAMATDQRPEVHSLLLYQTHRYILTAFEPVSGSVFAFEDLKRKHAELRRSMRDKDEEAVKLKQMLQSRDSRIQKLEDEKENTSQLKRELRKLRYALNRGRGLPVGHQESQPTVSPTIRTTVIESPQPCVSRQTNCCRQPGSQGRCPLENLKVALIGGLDRLEQKYRSAFEDLGAAKFLFHTGNSNCGEAQKLKSLTMNSDIVVFITSVNSHNALKVVKAICKRSGKSFIAIRETGPSQISKAVLQKMHYQE